MHIHAILYDRRRDKYGNPKQLIYVGILSEQILCVCPSTKAGVQKELQPYQSPGDKITIIDGIVMKS